ncbi:MAG: hypothetical protein IKA42_06635, partial [Clostridia bacterium]|nr:hypothetical protein [Clostridia bacterium]
EGSISANVTAINKNTNDLLALQGVVDVLEGKVDANNTTLANSIATLETALQSADDEIKASVTVLQATLNSEVARLEGLISNNATGNTSNGQDIASVASDLNDLAGVVNTIKINLELADYYLEKEIADLEVALTSADDAIKASVTELGAKLEEKVNELNGLITANKNGIEDNAEKINSLSAELTTITETVSALSARVESDYATKELLDQANASLLAAMQLGDKQVKDELNGTINGLIAEINKIKDLNEKQQSQIVALLVATIVVSVVAVGSVVAIIVSKKSKRK